MLDASLAIKNTLAYSNGNIAPELAYAFAAEQADESQQTVTAAVGAADTWTLLSIALLLIVQALGVMHQTAKTARVANQIVRVRQ